MLGKLHKLQLLFQSSTSSTTRIFSTPPLPASSRYVSQLLLPSIYHPNRAEQAGLYGNREQRGWKEGPQLERWGELTSAGDSMFR